MFTHLPKTKKAKRANTEEELRRKLAESTDLAGLAHSLARLVRWLEGRGALIKDSYPFTGRQVRTWSQLAVELSALRVIIDWTSAKLTAVGVS